MSTVKCGCRVGMRNRCGRLSPRPGAPYFETFHRLQGQTRRGGVYGAFGVIPPRCLALAGSQCCTAPFASIPPPSSSGIRLTRQLNASSSSSLRSRTQAPPVLLYLSRPLTSARPRFRTPAVLDRSLLARCSDFDFATTVHSYSSHTRACDTPWPSCRSRSRSRIRSGRRTTERGWKSSMHNSNRCVRRVYVAN